MRISLSLRTLIVSCVLAGLTACTVGIASAREPALEFLKKLRAARHHELALVYLDRMKTSRLATPELKDVILYEEGVTLVEGSRLQRDFGRREQWLNDASSRFKEFLATKKDHKLALAASGQLGNVLIEHGRIQVARAASSSGSANKATLLAEAKKAFDEALQVFEQNKATIRARLEKLPKDKDLKKNKDKDAAIIEKRDALRAEYVQAQLVMATVIYESAGTVKSDKAQYEALIKKAAEVYGEVADKYGKRLAGLYAMLYQGRCYQDLGNYEEALDIYDLLMIQPDQPKPFRSLKTKTFKLAMECWLAMDKKAKPDDTALLDDALERVGSWLAKAQLAESKGNDWLEVRLLFAQVNWAKSKKKKKELTGSVKGRLKSTAMKEAKFVTRYGTGDIKKKAQDIMLQWRKEAGNVEIEEPEPETFADARDAGREALELMQGSQRAVALLKQKIPAEKDAKQKAAMQAELEAAQKQSKEAEMDAVKYFELASTLVDDSTTTDEVNIVRYFLCYLYYIRGDYYASAVIGDFIARRYPQAAGSRQCAKIAMASFVKLYAESTEEDRGFEVARIVGVAEYITRKWPGQPEAKEALTQLVNFMIQQGELDRAEHYLEQIPPNSSQRGEAELRTGQALWTNYLIGMQKLRMAEEGAAGLPDEKELDELKARSQKILAAGIERMRGQGLNGTIARAALSLAQIYVNTDQPDKAIALLEDKAIGPKTIVETKGKLESVFPGADKAGSRKSYAEGTYKAALRAYIGALPTADDPDTVINKATGVMDALKKYAGDSEKGRRNLIAIYVSMARELEQQMQIADDATKAKLARGFETFLSRLGDSASELNMLNWIAETYFSMGSGFDQGQDAVSPEAKNYYGKATAMYEKILRMNKASTLKLEPNMVTQIRMRIAAVRRRMGEHEKAISIFEEILKKKEATINVQVEAAMTFQQWAAVGDPEHYYHAIKGDRMNKATGRYTIWGWGRLAQKVARLPAYKDTFHKARYNLALCRYSYAMRQSKDKRPGLLKMAKRDVSLIGKLYPNMGGDAWRDKYDALLKEIQKALGEEPAGLDEFHIEPEPDDASGGGTPAEDKSAEGYFRGRIPTGPLFAVNGTDLSTHCVTRRVR